MHSDAATLGALRRFPFDCWVLRFLLIAGFSIALFHFGNETEQGLSIARFSCWVFRLLGFV